MRDAIEAEKTIRSFTVPQRAKHKTNYAKCSNAVENFDSLLLIESDVGPR